MPGISIVSSIISRISRPLHKPSTNDVAKDREKGKKRGSLDSFGGESVGLGRGEDMGGGKGKMSRQGRFKDGVSTGKVEEEGVSGKEFESMKVYR